MLDFDIILGKDWLAPYYVVLDLLRQDYYLVIPGMSIMIL